MGEKKRRLAAQANFNAGPVAKQGDMRPGGQLARYQEECEQLEQVIGVGAAAHQALYQLSVLRHRMYMLQRESIDDVNSITLNLNRALDAITQALLAQPSNDAYWIHFAQCISLAALRHPLAPLARQMLSEALEHPAIQPLSMVSPIVALVRSQPAFPEVEKYLAPGIEIGSGEPPHLLEAIGELFLEPLLLRLLVVTIVPSPLIERLMVLARHLVLRKSATSLSETSPLPLAALAAISHQCFATEYVYDVSADESAEIAALEDAIESRRARAAAVPSHWIAILSCYRALQLTDVAGMPSVGLGVTDLRGLLAPDLRGLLAPDLQSLVQAQITEPAEERRLRAGIPTIAFADNSVSGAVSSMYESNPYPRWLKTVQVPASGRLREVLRQSIPQAMHLADDDSRPCILIAGCGTGQHSIETAQRYRDSRVLAIDLSLASLAYAKRKTLELGLDNVEYRQCDILQMSSFEERFDLIESIGVLHHLEDPLQGWRVLRGLLKPRGVMRIGLYSNLARMELIPVTEWIAAQGLNPDMEGIRRCRAQVRAMYNEVDGLIFSLSPDFYSAAGCRDLMFHVMEHRYTWPQIRTMIGQLDLDYLGLQPPTTAIEDLYRAKYPDDPAMNNLDHWYELEIENPWMFRGLYKFWVQAKN